MNRTIAVLTMRQLLGRRRTLLLAALGALMLVVAIIHRLGGDTSDAAEWTIQLLATFGITTLLPLVALIIGTGAFGAEVDDGTIVHLLAKPVPRWQIVLTKAIVAAVLTGLLTAIPIAAAALMAGGERGGSLAVAFVVGDLLGSLVYTALFLAAGLVTSRAFIVGLIYVLVWEGFLAALFAGTKTFSVRQQALSVADSFTSVQDVLGETLALPTALVVAALAVVVAMVIAVRRLGAFEIRGETT
jgi:ABC-2 type transport system permease protein